MGPKQAGALTGAQQPRRAFAAKACDHTTCLPVPGAAKVQEGISSQRQSCQLDAAEMSDQRGPDESDIPLRSDSRAGAELVPCLFVVSVPGSPVPA